VGRMTWQKACRLKFQGGAIFLDGWNAGSKQIFTWVACVPLAGRFGGTSSGFELAPLYRGSIWLIAGMAVACFKSLSRQLTHQFNSGNADNLDFVGVLLVDFPVLLVDVHAGLFILQDLASDFCPVRYTLHTLVEGAGQYNNPGSHGRKIFAYPSLMVPSNMYHLSRVRPPPRTRFLGRRGNGEEENVRSPKENCPHGIVTARAECSGSLLL